MYPFGRVEDKIENRSLPRTEFLDMDAAKMTTPVTSE